MNIKLIAILLSISLALNVYLGYFTTHTAQQINRTKTIYTIILTYNETFNAVKSGKYIIYLEIKNRNITYVNAIIQLMKINHNHKEKVLIVELNSNQTYRIIHLSHDYYYAKIIYIVEYVRNISINNLGIYVNIAYKAEN
ncbi:hypothetical protein SJAV_07200 [Sulfurisphaera javensis]|uniref:Uncharacterized protein n=1 Tax=Sulfurisphaera javensis TaxID=2049879 RepID=A0AAT9GPP9_9CREN